MDLYAEKNHELAILELERPFETDSLRPLGYIVDQEDETTLGNF